MYSLPPSLSFLLFLILALTLLSLPSVFSTSKLDQDPQMKGGIKLSLKRAVTDENLITTHDSHRLRKLSEIMNASKDPEIKSTVYPGDGSFLMELSIGTPPNTYSAIMDTGSDLIWTQCKPCQHCFHQPTPVFDPKKSSSFSKMRCSSNLCKALRISICNGGCVYYDHYPSGFTLGVLASETFTFNNVSVPKIGFGCGKYNMGDKLSQVAGIVGLGRGPLSLVSQLSVPMFSYCLTSIHGNKTSTLLMGSSGSTNISSDSGDIKTTPLIRNPKKPTHYYLSLEGITVGNTKLPIKKSTFSFNADGSGGLVIDSGTTITFLEESAFALVKKEFISQVNLTVDNSVLSSIILDLCFKMPSGAIHIPKLVFHFKGASLDLPRENYMLEFSSQGVICLAMRSSKYIPLSIFGNMQQQNMMVTYDLEKETVSFMSMKCDQL